MISPLLIWATFFLIPVNSADAAAIKKCNYRFCKTLSNTFMVGKFNDVAFTGAICSVDGSRVGTIGDSGEAYLLDGTLISEFSPKGLEQKFSPDFFSTYTLKLSPNANYHPYSTSGVGHETPQKNQARFLNDRTWILPLRAIEILDKKHGYVLDNIQGGEDDCILFKTNVIPQ